MLVNNWCVCEQWDIQSHFCNGAKLLRHCGKKKITILLNCSAVDDALLKTLQRQLSTIHSCKGRITISNTFRLHVNV